MRLVHAIVNYKLLPNVRVNSYSILFRIFFKQKNIEIVATSILMKQYEILFRHLSHSHNYPTSNSATQHSDIYRGNSTLTLFEPDCPSISYREAFCLPNAKFARVSENRSITGLSRLFSFDP